MIVRTTRVTLTDGDLENYIIKNQHNIEGDITTLTALEKRTLELEIESFPLVTFLESQWHILSQLLTPIIKHINNNAPTTISSNNDLIRQGNETHNQKHFNSLWCADVCEFLKVISTLPLRRNASLAAVATDLILQFTPYVPNAVLDYIKEFSDIWGAKGDDEYFSQYPAILANSQSLASSHGLVLHQVTSQALNEISQQYTLQNTSLPSQNDHGGCRSVDIVLLLSTSLSLLKKTPLILLTCSLPSQTEDLLFSRLTTIAIECCSSNEVAISQIISNKHTTHTQRHFIFLSLVMFFSWYDSNYMALSFRTICFNLFFFSFVVLFLPSRLQQLQWHINLCFKS